MSGATPLVDDVPDIPEQKATTQACSTRVYNIYVLTMLLLTYLVNQLDRFLLGIVTKPMSQELGYGDWACMRNESVTKNAVICNATSEDDCISEIDVNGTRGVCKWDHNGQGLQYEILAGPVFIVIYSLAGIPISVLADFSNRRNLLIAGLALWSAMTLVTGFVQRYWQLVVTRFLLAVGEAACTPLASSIIADYFVAQQRALALGFYNWGIYIGYSMSYAVGNFVTLSLGWRWTWIISGIPGIVLAAVILITVREPVRSVDDTADAQSEQTTETQPGVSWQHTVGQVCKTFFQPSSLMLCLAGSIRNAAGYVWAYNAQIYYQAIGTEDETIAWYMSWIPLVFGCVGVSLGGFISDRIVKRLGPYARLAVLIASQAVAVPFVAGALYFNPPIAFVSLIPAYVVGEMWVGITLAVVIEVVPVPLRTSAVAVYMFIISNIGGNVPLLVPVLKSSFQDLGYDSVSSLRAALYVLVPGLYLLGAVLFVAALLTLRWDLQRHQRYEPLTTRPHSN